MTIQQANQYFAALPDGFADPEQLGALLPASVQLSLIHISEPTRP